MNDDDDDDDDNNNNKIHVHYFSNTTIQSQFSVRYG
jgi:hypothetical protein